MTTTITKTSRLRQRTGSRAPSWLGYAALLCCLGLGACSDSTRGPGADDHDDGHSGEDRWSVTAWGSRFEVFPEIDALMASETSMAHVHVTRLDGYSPVAAGSVAVVLSSPAGEQVFRAEAPTQPGIFTVPMAPTSSAEFDVSFRIETPDATEEIRGGRVLVGTTEHPGRLLVAPAPKGGDGGEPVAFTKEQQWRSDFATAWVRQGAFARSVEGLTRLRPPAGGETVISSPFDGVVHAAGPWPFAGRRVERGVSLFRVAPRIAAERSLAALEAEAASFEIEAAAVRARLARLEELLAIEATSQQEVESVRQRAQVLEARHAAAAQDLQAARTVRRGGAAGAVDLQATFAGVIAEVGVTPGATVAAGDALARLVRTDVVWLEVALPATDAAQIAQLGREAVRGIVLTDGRRTPIRLEDGVQLIAVAPEASPVSGTVAVLFASPATEGLTLGTSLQGLVLLNETQSGIVIPSSAVVDDGGVSVVYLQLSGERFLRQEIQILARQGDRVLVDGLEPGQRLVHRGGNAIRRASLMSRGESHGHVH